jgi:hypothetical protein
VALFFPFSSVLTAGASSDGSPSPSSTITATRGRLLEPDPSGVGVAARDSDFRLPNAANPFPRGVPPDGAAGKL